MRRSAALVASILALALASAARAEEAAPPAAEAPATEATEPASATPQWSCETCPYQTGWQGDFGLDAFVAAGASAWSTRAWPYDDGVNLGLRADLMRLDADGTRVDVVARDLGLDDSMLMVEIGRAGRYEAGFDWWSKRWVTAEAARTPFDGAGSATLTLPAGWVRGDATTDLTQLASALHPVEMATTRERVGAHGTWWARNGWETSLAARIDTKRGTDAVGGSFLTRSTLLPEPIDHTTESLVAAATYGDKRWDVTLRYLLSAFDAGADSLTFDDPFLALHPTADQGQLALAPDNEFQQITVDGHYRTAGGIRLEGGAALGFGTQDAALVPATLNPGLAVALPRSSAAAEVATQLLYARAAIPMDAGVALRAEVRYDARDASTPQDYWTQVVTDTYVAAARPNVAYDHQKTQLKVEGDWTIGSVRFLARARNVTIDRDQEVVARTSEDQLTLEAHGPLLEFADWGVEVGRDLRDASPYAAPAGPAPQNPLLTMYPYAEMDRDRIALSFGAAPTADLSFALRFERRREDYAATEIGLTDRDDTGVGFDAALQVTEDMTLGAWYGRQTLASDQAGSTTYSTPDWSARSEDATEAFGLTFAAPWLTDALGLRVELDQTETTGLVAVDVGATDRFPETRSTLRRFVAMADYRWSERVELRFGFRLEDLRVADWALHGVAPDTVSNLLWSGQLEPDYELEVFELGVTMKL